MPAIHSCWETYQSINCLDNSVNNFEVSVNTMNNAKLSRNVMNNVEISGSVRNNTKVSGDIENNALNNVEVSVDTTDTGDSFSEYAVNSMPCTFNPVVLNCKSPTSDKDLHVTDGACQANASLGCNSRQLKFMIWNIHGLANKLDSKEFVEYINKYDIVVFLETMKRDPFEPVIRNFEFVHFQRKYQHPRARRPAGGMGIMIRTTLTNTNTVTIVKKSDFSVWLKIKQQGDLDLYIGAVYIPPLDSTSTISSFQDNNAYHLLQEDVTHFSQKGYVSLCGDFNARTGTLIDYVTTCGNDTHDVYVPQTNKVKFTFPIGLRHSDDTKFNQYGKDLLQLCKSSEMRMMNGCFKNDHGS